MAIEIFGAGLNNASLEAPYIDGLGAPTPKTQDVEWTFRDGSYGNPDYDGVRVVTFHVILRNTDATAVLGDLQTLEAAFAPVTADIALVIKLPGWGASSMQGRPRGIVADLTRVREGIVRALCRFDCPNPEMTF